MEVKVAGSPKDLVKALKKFAGLVKSSSLCLGICFCTVEIVSRIGLIYVRVCPDRNGGERPVIGGRLSPHWPAILARRLLREQEPLQGFQDWAARASSEPKLSGRATPSSVQIQISGLRCHLMLRITAS